MIKLDMNEFKMLRDFIELHCGIHLDETKTYLIETRLTTLLAEQGCTTYSDFYFKAKNDPTNTLREKIIDAMTTNETLWFRDATPFNAFQKHFLPHFGKEIASGKKSRIRIWSAASSTGQEIYSIAMLILEYCRLQTTLRPEHFELLATDISPTVLFLAKAGRYDTHVISRGLPDEMKKKYFKSDGKIWVIDDCVKKMVTFKKLNLQEDFSFVGKMDLIFCRNVLIYFSEELKKDLLHRFGNLLRPGGYLLVGSAESISNYSSEYSLHTFEKAMYYQIK
jgi:chemotaxis protein methyltransferase CheR